MKALILNSGLGTRMGNLTFSHPKCMTELDNTESILSRQLKQLEKFSITDVIITTGLFHDILIDYCHSLNLSLAYTFVHNPLYEQTNYIYSIFLARTFLKDDLLLLHGDLVFEDDVLRSLLNQEESCMTISSTLPLPEKDFKAVIINNRISKIGIEFFQNALAAQPLYKLKQKDWLAWLSEIECFCSNSMTNCYAENAFNKIASRCSLYPFDIKDALCNEIDTPTDLESIKTRLEIFI